jgi:curved DNA-binding protein CbpA
MILGVVQTDTLEVIARSYKRLALKLHPDRNAEQNATEAFQLVSWMCGAHSIFSSQVVCMR